MWTSRLPGAPPGGKGGVPRAGAAGMCFGVAVPGEVIRCLSLFRGDISHYLWWALRHEAEQLVAHHRLFG